MSEELPYNKRESDILFKGINDNFDRLFDTLKGQDETLKRIEGNQNTNAMDILIIKDTIKDYPVYKATTDSLVNYKWWVIGAMAAFTILGGSVVLLFEAKIDTKISNGIDAAFNNKFAKVQVINNN